MKDRVLKGMMGGWVGHVVQMGVGTDGVVILVGRRKDKHVASPKQEGGAVAEDERRREEEEA